MIKKQWIIMLVLVLFAFGIFGCGQDTTGPDDEGPGEEEGTILIGIMVPVTGAYSENGIDMENAVKLAVNEINAAGGILGHTVVTTTGDDECDPAKATAAASKLVSEEVVGVVGGYCSGATLPTLKIYGDAGIPLVVAAANATSLVEENPGWTFMINSTGDMQAENAIGWFEKQGVETIGLIDDGSAFATDLKMLTKQQWEAKGKIVLTDDTVTTGEQDFSALVTTIMSANPDGIYWTAYHAEGALIVRQLREAGYEGIIIVADGSSAPAFIELAGPYADGVFCTAPPFADLNPAAAEFVTNYKEMFNSDPGAYSGLTYDAMYLLADAIERAGSFDDTAIKDALAATDGFQGISGEVMFTEKNTLGRSNFVILVVEDGKWTFAE
ncbi:MAG: branched-chain amino acid ABC transporter substrate-binding protein [Bacillota bacterium]|nr:branched-chain amino acid ABC transporter substrate-binding protein [Bacillota bacterium]